MKKRAFLFLEFTLLIVTALFLVSFIEPPNAEQRKRRKAPQPAPTPTSISQVPEPWDKNLVLPTQSDRVANYLMDVSLDTSTNIISGWEILEWRNTTGKPQSAFPFHLYHNAWKNNRSTFVKEGRGLGPGMMMPPEGDLGYTNVKSVKLLDPRGEIDVTNTFRYVDADGSNPDDQTVFEISTPKPVRPNAVLKLKIEFETKQPRPIARTGVIRDFHFVVQWFPKIGVWWKGAWNCHAFHATSEFFADYGVYDVTLTIPTGYVVGATGGEPRWQRTNENGTSTYNFYQADVHDFAWLTSPDLVRNVRKFSHTEPDDNCRLPGRHHRLKEVTVIVLTQPHHGSSIDRYFDATFKALRFYGEWYGQYPYDFVTVVDPANGSRAGGMEYPTLFTGGTSMFSPKEVPQPEGVTVHEFGHQFWYGLVGNNEFEEAWLDEGFNTYSTSKTIDAGWPPFKAARFYFGGPGASAFVGIPYVFSNVDETRVGSNNLTIQQFGKNDVMTRNSWEYYQSYSQNVYTKTALSLLMLERYLGDESMYRVMRTYHHRFRFKHPTSQDFINTVNEVSGKNMNWFFENTWFSSNVFDYKIEEITNRPVLPPMGLFTINGKTVDKPAMEGVPAFECDVVVKREGEAIAPVDVLVVFENGHEKREVWDGQYRWMKYTYRSESRVKKAIVDPDQKLVLDVNFNNNSKVVREPGFHSMAARKIASKWMFWMQVIGMSSSFWH